MESPSPSTRVIGGRLFVGISALAGVSGGSIFVMCSSPSRSQCWEYVHHGTDGFDVRLFTHTAVNKKKSSDFGPTVP